MLGRTFLQGVFMNKRLPATILGLLVLQFLLGILASLYQEIPKGLEKYSVYHQPGFILVHVVNALALVVLSIILLVKAKRKKLSKKVVSTAVGGLGSIVVAYAAGILFVETANDLFSVLMALGFIGAFLPYARLVYGPELSSKQA